MADLSPDAGDPSASPSPSPPDDGSTTFSDDPMEHSTLSATFMVMLLVTWLIFGHKIQGMFHWTRWISEGSMACLLGVLSGIALLVWDVFHANFVHKSLSFDSAAFFTYMLPPIIFYGGLAIKRKLFVSNLLSILSFGVLGTFISFTLIGVILYALALLPNVLSVSDCFSLAAIFAATDSVAVLSVLRPEAHPALYSIVLGEGVLNDATSVALLRSVKPSAADTALTPGLLLSMMTFFAYVFAASFALGASCGLAIAAAMKHLGPFSQPQEVALVGALAFLSYLLAEVLGLSGILALFFCGMAVSHYALQHVNPRSRAALLNAFATLSYLLEGFIFLYVGRDALDPVKWSNASFFQTLFLVVVIAALVAFSRACFVFPLAWLHNRWSDKTISVKDTIVVWWAGMMRGAVSVAMVYYRFDPKNEAEDKHAATIVVTTLQLVLYSTVGMGGVTGPLLKFLLPQQVKPPDVTGAQLHQDHRGPESPSLRRLRRNGSSNSFDSAFADDQYHTLLPLQRRGSSRFGSGADLHTHGRSPPGAARAPPDLFADSNASRHAPNGTGLELGGVTNGASSPPRLGRPPAGKPHGKIPPRSAAATTGSIQSDVVAAVPRLQAQHPANTPDKGSAQDDAGTAAEGSGPATRDAAAAVAGTSARIPGVAAAAQAASSSTADMGSKVLSAAQNIAQMTDFEAHGMKANTSAGASADGALGEAMYERFRAFDSKYLQPLFGKGEVAFRSSDLSDTEGRQDDDKDEGHALPPDSL